MPGSLRHAIEEFYEEQTYKGNSPAPVRFYRVNMEHYQSDTGVTTLEGFTPAPVRRWLLDHRHLSRASLRTYDRSMRVVGNWLHRRGYLPSNPMHGPAPEAEGPATHHRDLYGRRGRRHACRG